MNNYREAVKWFRLAAEQGDAKAQYNLGWCYYNGQGVTKNYKETVKWYTLAAQQGDAGAQFYLQKLTKKELKRYESRE
jgi:FOG: TPR repeat, SEL1 subfamily